MTRAAGSSIVGAMRTIVSPRMPISAVNHGLPVPSTTRPFRRSRSSVGACAWNTEVSQPAAIAAASARDIERRMGADVSIRERHGAVSQRGKRRIFSWALRYDRGSPPMATTPAAPPVPMTFRDVLRLTVMRRVWYAQVVSLLGDFLAVFALISVVSFRLHGTPAQVTGVQIAYMLPLALLGPLAGVFVDRWPLKPTLIASDLIRAVLVILLFLSTAVWQIYLALIAISCVSSFFGPAQSV